MNKAWIPSVVCWLAGIVFCVGLAAATLSLSRCGKVNHKLEQSILMIDRLDAIERESQSLDAVVKQFDALRYDRLVNLQSVANSAFGDDHVDVVRERVESCDEGFSVKRYEIFIKDISLETLLPFVNLTESQRPPLRLAACTIHASAARSGYGDVTLKLERIER